MASEIRANKQTNRVGLGTVTYTDTGIIVSGIVTANSISGGSSVTATTFYGSGSALTGIDATALKDPAGNVKIQAQDSGAFHTGFSTFSTIHSSNLVSNNADIDDFISVGSNINLGNAGVVTATSFVSTGQVLIGIDNAVDAEADLQIHSAISGNGPILNMTNDTGDCRIFFGQDNSSGSANAQGQLRYNVSSNYLATYTSGSEKIRITSAGRMGLGETSPDGDLHIKSSNPGIVLEDSTGSSQHGQAIIEQNGDNLKIRQDAGNASSGTASNISLQVDAFERLKIASSGALTNTTNSSHSQGAGTFNIKGVINQYSQGSGSGLIFDCDFGRLTGYGDNSGIANSANLSSALMHSTTDWTSSSSNTPMTVNGGSFNYRVGRGGYLDCVQNEGRVSIGAGSGSPNMAETLNTASMTIESWIWYDGAGREVIVSRYGSGFPNQFNMLCDPDGQFHYNNSGVGAGSGNITGQNFPDKTWHHHVWQYDSGNNVNRWYINGAFASSASAGSSLAVSSASGFAIASRADDMERWDGKIAVVRIYNRALSAAEIKNHFELDRGRFGV